MLPDSEGTCYSVRMDAKCSGDKLIFFFLFWWIFIVQTKATKHESGAITLITVSGHVDSAHLLLFLSLSISNLRKTSTPTARSGVTPSAP